MISILDSSSFLSRFFPKVTRGRRKHTRRQLKTNRGGVCTSIERMEEEKIEKKQRGKGEEEKKRLRHIIRFQKPCLPPSLPRCLEAAQEKGSRWRLWPWNRRRREEGKEEGRGALSAMRERGGGGRKRKRSAVKRQSTTQQGLTTKAATKEEEIVLSQDEKQSGRHPCHHPFTRRRRGRIFGGNCFVTFRGRFSSHPES